MRKPIHQWVVFTGDPVKDKECYKRYTSGTPIAQSMPGEDVVHFIDFESVKHFLSLFDLSVADRHAVKLFLEVEEAKK